MERKDETFLSFFYFQHKKHIVQKLSITLFEQVHNPQNCPSKSCPNFGKEIIAFLWQNRNISLQNITSGFQDDHIFLRCWIVFLRVLTSLFSITEKEIIANSKWPTYDSSKIVDDTYELVVQVNGKLRGKIEVDSDTSEEEMKEKAMTIENVKTFTEGKEIVKVIVIPKKLVNIVVK